MWSTGNGAALTPKEREIGEIFSIHIAIC